MNNLSDRLNRVDSGTLSKTHNLDIDIQEYATNTDLYFSQKTKFSSAVSNKDYRYELFLNYDRPRYTLVLVVGSFIIKRFSNIDSNSLLSYLNRYNIKINEDIKIII